MLSKLKSGAVNRFPGLHGRYVAAYRSVLAVKHNLTDMFNAYVPLKNNRPQMTPYGFKLLGGRSAHHRAMQEGNFEQDEVSIVTRCLSAADVFIDVGANIGFFSCLARTAGKHTIAIEPQPANLDCIYTNLILNGWNDVEVFPLGLGDKPGLLPLYGLSSTGASLIAGWAGSPKRFHRTIPISTLDIVLGGRFSGKKLLIKIDVEGVEHAVMKGSSDTLKMSPKPTWILEICLGEYHPGGMNPDYADTFAIFWRNGYEARTADHRNLVVGPSDIERHVALGQSDMAAINFVFSPLPDDRAERKP